MAPTPSRSRWIETVLVVCSDAALRVLTDDDSAGIDEGGGDEAARAAHPATESRARNHTQREIIDVLPR